MPDIFGKNPHDYRFIQAMPAEYRQQYIAASGHDFNAMQPGRPVQHAAAGPGDAGGSLLMRNTQAVRAQVMEILYANPRLDFVPIENVPEGATTFSIPVMDFTGEARFVDRSGADAPTVGSNYNLPNWPLRYAAAAAEIGLQERRQMEFAGIPFQNHKIYAAMMSMLQLMDKVVINGDSSVNFEGLLNLTGPIRTNASSTFAAADGDALFRLLEDPVIRMIKTSNEVVGTKLTKGLCICLPVDHASIVKTKLITQGDANITVWDYFRTKSLWNNYTNEEPMLKIIPELATAGTGNNARMIVYLKDPEVLIQGVGFMPRLVEVVNMGLYDSLPFESYFGGVQLLRQFGVQYVDGI